METVLVRALHFIFIFLVVASVFAELILVKSQLKRSQISLLSKIDGLICPHPTGAFYAFPHIGNFIGKSYKGEVIETDVHFCTLLLQHAHVACVPGSAFGDNTAFRISYVTEETQLKEGLKRIRTFISEIE